MTTMKEVPITISFNYQDVDTPGWDYDDDHLVPSMFSVEDDVSGDPYEKRDLTNLYRYVCYRLQLDNLNKKEFIKNFIDTCKEATKKINEAIYLETYDLTLYGKCDPMLTLENYEFTERVEVKRIGKLSEGIRTYTKKIQPFLGEFYLTAPLIITDSKEKGKLIKSGEYYREYILPLGNYDIYKIYNKNEQLRATCLLLHGVDFYSVDWEDQLTYTTERNQNTTQILCTKKAVTDGIIDNLEQVDDVKTDGNSYITVPVFNTDGQSRYASSYIARRHKQTIGIAFDNIGCLIGERIDLNQEIREL